MYIFPSVIFFITSADTELKESVNSGFDPEITEVSGRALIDVWALGPILHQFLSEVKVCT